MPNIIEQQDLLKGLPDERLATLMQAPTGGIPPFLVAAEAQRRQSIREQFSGGTNESVVDTLTKQLSNVPQNIQTPMRAPPKMPPPMQPQMQPQMAGINSLPQGQQQMAEGGMVQRYQEGGKIQPMWTIPNYGGAIPKVMDWVGDKASDLYDYATTSYSDMKPGADTTEEEVAPGSGILDINYPDVKIVPGRNPLPDRPSTPPNPNAGKENTSPTNKEAPAQDEIRKRIEELYGSEDPSSWENAQKWFAMSQQIMDPDVNLLQGLVNAGSVYAQAEAEQARAAREDLRNREESLLKYDINKMESDAATEAAGLKARTDVATGQLDDLYRQQRDVAEQLRRIEESAIKDGTDPALLEGQKALLTRQFNAIGSKISTYEGFIGQTYGFPTIPVVDTATGTIK